MIVGAPLCDADGHPYVIRTHPDDNVVIAVTDVPVGTEVLAGVVTADAFRLGQKIAAAVIEPGQPVLRYGEHIGTATAPIEPGQLVHDHNLVSGYQTGVTRRDQY